MHLLKNSQPNSSARRRESCTWQVEKEENGKMEGIKYKVSWLLNHYVHILFHNAYKISAIQSTEIPLTTCQPLTKHPPVILMGYPSPSAFCCLLHYLVNFLCSCYLWVLTYYCPTVSHADHLAHGDFWVSQLFTSLMFTVLCTAFGNVLPASHLDHQTILTQCSIWRILLGEEMQFQCFRVPR